MRVSASAARAKCCFYRSATPCSITCEGPEHSSLTIKFVCQEDRDAYEKKHCAKLDSGNCLIAELLHRQCGEEEET